MTVEVSAHAITRFQERVRPGLTWYQCKVELERLAATVKLVDPPDWLFLDPDDPPDAIGEISEGVVLILKRAGHHFAAVSCLTRATLAPAARDYRNRARTRRRARVHALADKGKERRTAKAMDKERRHRRDCKGWAA